MPNITKVAIGGTTYNTKDELARAKVEEADYKANMNAIMTSGACVNSSGSLITGSNYCYLIFPIIDQVTILVSGYDFGPTYPLCVFLGADGSVIDTLHTGGGPAHMMPVSVPNGAKYVYVNGNTNEQQAVSMPLVLDNRYNGSVLERIRTIEDKLSNIKPAEGAELYTGRAIKSDGSYTESTQYCYKEYSLNGARYIICSGYDYGTDWPLCVYFDENDEVVGISKIRSSGKTVMKAEIVPEGATKVCINGNVGSANQIEPNMYISADNTVIWDYIISMFEEVQYDDIVLGAAYNSWTNSETKGNNYTYVSYKVSNDDILLIHGNEYGTNWPLGTFVNASGNPVLTVRGDISTIGMLTAVPENADRLIVNGRMTGSMRYPHIYRLVCKNKDRFTHNYTYGTTKKRRLFSLTEAFNKWFFGEKFPICVLGDSTTDGDQTTGGMPNQIGTDHQDPNTYTTKLQILLREATGNNTLRIYNGGFTGKSATWTLQNIDEILWNNVYYQDAKIVIISHGINDYVPSGIVSSANYEHALRGLIQNIFDHGAQPVLMTHQSGMENYERFGWKQMSLADEITKNLADEYNLEVMDKNYYTNLFNIYSQYSISDIIPDGCHYKDVGHAYIAGWMFKELIPYTIPAGDEETVISFADERVKTGLEYSSVSGYVWKDVKIITPANGFKLEAQCEKNAATVLMDVWVFVESKGQKELISYCTTPNAQTITLDGVTHTVTQSEQSLGQIDIGLHHIVVSSAASNSVNYLGLKIK